MHQHLLDLRGIGDQFRRLVAAGEHNEDLLPLGQVLHQFTGAVGNRPEVDRPTLQPFVLSELKHALDNLPATQRLGLDVADRVLEHRATVRISH